MYCTYISNHSQCAQLIVHPLNDKVVELVLVSEDGLHDVAGGLAPVDSAAHQGGVAVAAGNCTEFNIVCSMLLAYFLNGLIV